MHAGRCSPELNLDTATLQMPHKYTRAQIPGWEEKIELEALFYSYDYQL